ncbi:MAG: CoA transferase, partial [Ilumatobacteraceae bacterium]
ASTRAMADFGADVIRVESTSHLDVARTIGPLRNDLPGVDASGLLYNMATGKRGVSLDLTQPAARSVLDDLVRWCDVLVESFSPRGRATLDLDYDRLKQLNPEMIMMSTCLFGQTGPLQRYAGFGTMGAALCGFFHLTGWEDRPPCGPFGAYSDYPSPRFALCALLGAIEHKRRTGEGQYLDFAQAEAAAHFLTPALLDYAVNGVIANRAGNTDVVMTPHGVFPSAGDDQWIAIACRDDVDWRSLATTIGHAGLAALATAERRTRSAELENLIGAWTAVRSPADAQAVLIAAGVPAHAVQNSPECACDPQLLHQGHFIEVPHSEHGTVIVEGSRTLLSATPAVVSGAPPLLGQDTVDVLTDVLGYDDERLGELFAASALD